MYCNVVDYSWQFLLQRVKALLGNTRTAVMLLGGARNEGASKVYVAHH